MKPAETLDIDIRTEKDSFVGLLAVDQSVLLLKSGNDISRDEVVQQLEMYESAQNYHWDAYSTSDCQVLVYIKKNINDKRIIMIVFIPFIVRWSCSSFQ